MPQSKALSSKHTLREWWRAMVGKKAAGQLGRPPPMVDSRGEAKGDFPEHDISVSASAEGITEVKVHLPIDNRNIGRHVSAPRSVKSR